MLKVKNVHVAINQRAVLSNFCVDLHRSELVVVLGPNGAGKSTFLKTLSGELKCDSGEILFEDKAISEWPVEYLALRMAVLPQESELNFPFLVEEVVALGRYPHSSGSAVDAAIVKDAMKEVDIQHLAERAYNTLSGGEKQRVHIARVFAQILDGSTNKEKKILLLDEPNSQLDIEHQHKLMLSLLALKQSGVCIVIVMHDFNLAAQYADRVMVIGDQALLAFGRVEQVFTTAMFKEVFNVEATLLEHPDTGRPVIVSKL